MIPIRSDNDRVVSDLWAPNQAAGPAPRQRRRLSRWLQWLIVSVAGLLAWILFMLGAVLQHEFLVLFFPAGWCVYVAMRQFRQITRERGGAE